MAGILNWTNFANRIKSLIKLPFRLLEMQTTESNNIVTLRENIMPNFDTSALRDVETLIYDMIEGGQESMNSFKESVFPVVNQYLDNVADELDLPENEREVNDVIDQLIDEMNEDSETVLENTVSASDAADTDNTGDGNLFVTVKDAEGLDNEFIIPELITLECTSDNAQTNVIRGEEAFSVSGEPLRASTTHLDRGSGDGPTLRVVTSSALNQILNGAFEDFATANTPNNWDIDNGVAGTNIFEETTNKFNGDSALKLLDAAGATTIQLSQDLETKLEGVTRYSFSCQLKTASISAGTVSVKLTGTGMSPVTLFSYAAAWPTSWSEEQAFFNMPDTIPEDLEIEIKMTGGNAGAIAYIDDLAIAEVVYHNGVGLALTRGAVDWVIDDRLEVTVSNDEAGNIQSFFGRYYGRKLPSATSGAQTINDTL